MPNSLTLPSYIAIVFMACVIFTLIQLYRIFQSSTASEKIIKRIMAGILLWTIIQSVLAYIGFYSNAPLTLPPRFLLAFAPVMVFFIYLFNNAKGKAFIDSLSMKEMTWLSIVRIPIEFCLYWLFLSKAIPELMTFSGRNFDILAGLTAPLVAYFGIAKGKLGKTGLLIWNVVSLALLLFIVVNALFSAPTGLQQFAFDQPNIAVIYFPFVLLPATVVTAVLFTHFTMIRRLTVK